MTTAQQQIERLRELLAKATDGPWFNDFGKIGAESDECGIGEMDYSGDGKLVAALRNSADALIECAEVLQQCGVVLSWTEASNGPVKTTLLARIHAALAKLEGK